MHFVRYCWRRAHRAAWKTPPLEIVRSRCRRAAELGLDYHSYTAVLLDRGSHLQALVFELGTLVEVRDDGIRLDSQGRVRPLPGVVETLSRLRGCRLFVVADRAGDAETVGALVGQLGALCGQAFTDWRNVEGPAASFGPTGAPGAETLRALLAGHRLAPSLAVMVGNGERARRWAEAAGLAAFVPAERYFVRGETAGGQERG